MNLYEFRGANGDQLEMNAATEQIARQQVMEARWGDQPDEAVPYQPYTGYGLTLWNVEENTKRKAKPIKRLG